MVSLVEIVATGVGVWSEGQVPLQSVSPLFQNGRGYEPRLIFDELC